MTGRYAVTVLLLGAAGSMVLWLLRGRFEPGAFGSAMLGAWLATAGSVAGLALTGWAFERDQKQFLATVMLGILGRLVVYGATLLWVALRTAGDPVAMAGALLAFYVMHHVVEIRFAVQRLKQSKRQAGAGRER